MRKYLVFIMLVLLLGVTYLYRENFIIFYINHFIEVDREPKLAGQNNYTKQENQSYVTKIEDFNPHSLQDLKNIYYTVLNAGEEQISFFCPEDYIDCTKDIKHLANDQATLSHINNFVHPFNGFKHIETEYDSLGKITITIDKTYNKEKQNIVLKKVNEIMEEIIDEKDNDEEKIKKIHDYIINHTKYDQDRSDKKIVKYDSDTAYGTLIEGYGLCGGYTDSMAIFLNMLGIKNYKVSSENHVWNAVYLDGKWYHLDLTWDDPITTDGKDIIEYNFFLIDQKELENLKTNQHGYDKTIYKELTNK